MAAQGVAFEQSYGCWLKNVEIKNSYKKEAVLIEFVSGEIRHCTFRDEIYQQDGVGREHEGLDFYIRGCWNLVEDNIFSNGGFAPITIGDSRGGCVGNVIGYNFVEKVNTATTIAGGAISFAHGGHNMFNLMEGNVVESGLSADGYWGSSSHNTMLRNWAAAKPYTVSNPPGFNAPTTVWNVSSSLRAVQLNRWNYFINVVGNVLGDSAFPTTAGAGAYTTEVSGYSGSLRLIYSLGYPYLGANDYNGTWGPQTPPRVTGVSPRPDSW